jgi:hypothetical protein
VSDGAGDVAASDGADEREDFFIGGELSAFFDRDVIEVEVPVVEEAAGVLGIEFGLVKLKQAFKGEGGLRVEGVAQVCF